MSPCTLRTPTMASANETVASPAAGAGLPAGTALPDLPALDNTFGALFLGTCFGLMCVLARVVFA